MEFGENLMVCRASFYNKKHEGLVRFHCNSSYFYGYQKSNLKTGDDDEKEENLRI